MEVRDAAKLLAMYSRKCQWYKISTYHGILLILFLKDKGIMFRMVVMPCLLLISTTISSKGKHALDKSQVLN